MVRMLNQRPPQQFAGLSAVILLHVLVIYAFVYGLAAHRTADSALPLEVRLAETPKPVTEKPVVFKPILADAPNFHVPPPPLDSIAPTDPPRGQTGITDNIPPEGPTVAAPAGGALQGSGTGVVPAHPSAQSDCSNAASLASSIEYPTRAKRLGIQQGQVNVEFSVATGGSLQIDAVTASNPVFEAAAVDAVKKLHCSAGRYRLPISFALQD